MHDEDTAAAGALQDLVQARSHLFQASHGVQALMRVPHVTHDDGRLIWLPLLDLLAHRVSAACGRLPETLVDGHKDGTVRFRTNSIERDRQRGKTSCRTKDRAYQTQ